MSKEWHELGQHELKNPSLFQPYLDNNDEVLEIGAGRGGITTILAKNCKKVLSFEIDKAYEEELAKISGKNTKIILGDCLDYDWIGVKKIVSNLPFHLAEPVIKKAIRSEIPELLLLLSEKSRYKLLSDEDFGFIIRKYYDTEVLEEVTPGNYEPEPSTTTWLIRMKKRENTGENDKIILNVYLGKGKIKNSIIKSLVSIGMTKNQAREKITSMKMSEVTLDKQCNKATIKLLKIINKKLE
ncbi:MAG: rRNA adenine N-6-methyltransferase family protein [Nanoarchaeota archaeon]